ncbi:MAG: WbqC family protein [Pseudomonadales bacterium]|nr:WbqC family protein [Pseudomonadales bacterium]
MSHTVAVMQPYWIPYPGYFRLLAGADTFVVLDDVQFPRRGYVHRNRLEKEDGELDWLTLPLVKAPRSVKISDLEFRNDAYDVMQAAREKFPIIRSGYGCIASEMNRLEGQVVPFLVRTLERFIELLEIETPIILASQILPPSGKDAQSRIIELVKELGGTEYLNSPGGQDLYEEKAFQDRGLSLRFLEPWNGSYSSILQQVGEPSQVERLKRDIINQC